MRIIAGALKGRRLELPKNSPIRPVTSQVLETVMNLFTPGRLTAGPFLDVCAGSGLVGFEAVSRGAPQTVFIEAEARTAQRIRTAAADFGVVERVLVLKTDARRCFPAVLKHLGRPAACVFLDPPFIPGMAAEILAALDRHREVLAPDGLAILRTPDRQQLALTGLELLERRESGQAALWLLRPLQQLS